jgi:hypothetical protein
MILWGKWIVLLMFFIITSDAAEQRDTSLIGMSADIWTEKTIEFKKGLFTTAPPVVIVQPHGDNFDGK